MIRKIKGGSGMQGIAAGELSGGALRTDQEQQIS